jgi:hypothetical protein
MTDVAPTPKPAAKSGSGISKKLGPLPIWAWALMIIATYFLYKYLKDRSSSSTTTAGTDAGLAAAGTGTAVDGSNGFEGGTNNVSTTGSTNESVSDWIDSAQTALENLGYSSDSVDQAFQDYLAGNPLSASELAIIDSATNLVGAAPAGLGIPNNGATGTPGTTTGTTTTTTTPTVASIIPFIGAGPSGNVNVTNGGSGTFSDPFSLISATSGDMINQISGALNNNTSTIYVVNSADPSAGPLAVEPGQSIAEAAIAQGTALSNQEQAQSSNAA